MDRSARKLQRHQTFGADPRRGVNAGLLWPGLHLAKLRSTRARAADSVRCTDWHSAGKCRSPLLSMKNNQRFSGGLMQPAAHRRVASGRAPKVDRDRQHPAAIPRPVRAREAGMNVKDASRVPLGSDARHRGKVTARGAGPQGCRKGTGKPQRGSIHPSWREECSHRQK